MQHGKFSAYPLALAMSPILFALLLAFGADSYGDGSPKEALSGIPSITSAATLTAIPSSVNKTITLATGTAFGSAIAQVEFLIDGNVDTSTSVPFAIYWDSSTVAYGTRSVVAHVADPTHVRSSSVAPSISEANRTAEAAAH